MIEVGSRDVAKDVIPRTGLIKRHGTKKQSTCGEHVSVCCLLKSFVRPGENLSTRI